MFLAAGGYLLLASLLMGCLSAEPITPTVMTATHVPTAIVAPKGWNLIWHDEFDGGAIDAKNWTYDLGGGGWGNGEMENYTARPENARLENGLLVIEARKETNADGGFEFTSARLKTQGLQDIPIWAASKRASKFLPGLGFGLRSGSSAKISPPSAGRIAAKLISWNTRAKNPT